jgi:tetratricopeptide (TPR) repeat protein
MSLVPRSFLFAGAVLALNTGCGDKLAPGRHAAAKPHAAEVEKALAAGDFGRAALAASAAVDADPFDASMRDLPTLVRLTTLARAPEAVTLDRAAELDYAAEMLASRDAAHRPDLLVARGQLALARNDLATAEKLFRDAGPGAAAKVALGRLLQRKGDDVNATAAFEAALAADPKNVAATVAVARTLVRTGKAPEAITRLQKAVQAQPENAALRRDLGVALFSARQVPEAGEQFQRAIALDPQAGEGKRLFADWLLATGQLDRAEVEYTGAAKLGAEPQATFGLAGIALRRKNFARAGQLYEAVANSQPSNLEAAFQAGMAFDQAGAPDAAAKWLARYVQAATPVPDEAARVAEASRKLTALVAAAKH